MAARSILDADMAMLWQWARSGMSWWLDALRSLLPAMLGRRDNAFACYAIYRGPGLIEITGQGKSMPVLIDPAWCLIRKLQLPAMSDADLRKLVQFDAERLFPLPSSQLVIEARASARDRREIVVAGLPRDRAVAILESLEDAGIAAERIALADPDRPGVAMLDFGRSLAEVGLVKPVQPVAAAWWTVVGFLFLLNVGLLVWREVQQLERLETVIAEQAPAVRAARVISGRIATTGRQAQLLAERRRQQDAAAILAAVTMALPAQAWVQRYSWDGQMIRISGYKRQGADVIGALRKSGRFSDVRAASAESIAEVPSGQPFDITAAVRAGVL